MYATNKIEFAQPFTDQRPGTSGLRKLVRVFQQPHYTETFIASIFHILPQPESAQNAHTLVVGGDGRFFVKETVQTIIRMACACPKISRLVIGANGILSTPAASNLILKRHAIGGILLTASHNPGGPDKDFGIKFNIENGGPARENITEAIFAKTKILTSYELAMIPEIDLSQPTVREISPTLSIEIVDPVNDYVILMKEIFDFTMIKNMIISRNDFSFLFDAMHGVTGPYAKSIFIDELGLPHSSVINSIPLPDFNNGHPDPNLTYAHELVEQVTANKIVLGAASDGDGDRNMIIGCNGAFVNPSDSVAIIAAWAARAIPYFKGGLLGVARSMPTSRALDAVAEVLKIPAYQVPTGWKYFGNLMDAGRISICGEESFGTGAVHIREKDGIWAVLAWLSILAYAFHSKEVASNLNDIMTQHFAHFGRNYFTRLDYEDVDLQRANDYIANIRKKISKMSKGALLGSDFVMKEAGSYQYKDPIDGSLAVDQGDYIVFSDDSRIVFRLSGTGSQGATIRIYIEKYDKINFNGTAPVALADLTAFCVQWSNIEEFTGRNQPSVIT